jgi:putative FmdB family regulatory protein
MPIYEYQCEACDACFERLVFGNEEEHVACPECRTKKVKRLISCTSFIGESGMGACTSKPSGGFA